MPVVEDLHAQAEVRSALLALNAESVIETSPLSPERFDWMIACARIATFVPPADAFLIAFAHDDAFDGGHFLWFRARLPSFLYVDRIVVAAASRGRGYGRLLYEDLFVRARAAGIDRIVCEVNAVPPNPRSAAFHARLGFQEIGTATLDGGAKTVRYLALDFA
ncbi:MAG: GNAT family N-acetyltransferase [Hyphomicrobiales bacterium]|nr:MAG: GNAT family N-acetyltransferase [Hyphomicrobiales bacterium]